MEFTAAQIAGLVQGEIIGDPDAKITGVAPIEEGVEDCLSFVAQEKFVSYIQSSPCTILIVSKNLFQVAQQNKTLILVEDAYATFQHLLQWYASQNTQPKGRGQYVAIASDAKVHDNTYIGDFCSIQPKAEIGENSILHGNCYVGKSAIIGKNVVLMPGVKVLDYCIVKDNCIIHSNTVIGSDGFGFQPGETGFSKIPQLGNVVIENNVEIGSNCTIDRGTFGSTYIGEGTKLDNLIQIAHNVKIGRHNVIAAQTGIAGSTYIGDWNMIGGQVGIVGHIKIGNHNKFQAKSGINKTVGDGRILYGSPAFDANNYRKNYVHFKNLSKIAQDVEELKKNKQ